MGFVDPAYGDLGSSLAVEVIGEPVPAVVAPACAYDPTHSRMRA